MHQHDGGRVLLRVLQVVEAAHLVRAVVRAVAGADAAVINLLVDTFGRVHRSVERADRSARRFFAVLAHHRLEIDLGVLERTAIVGIDADPVHFAAHQDLVFTNDRRVVFALATDDAGVATDA